MMQDDDEKPHVEGRPSHRVSSAVWPSNVRHVVATGKAAQRRRDWIMQRHLWVALATALSMRVLLVLTTLLVVISSLFVAVLGLQFWFLLLLPLLLFALLLFVPSFLASKLPAESVPPSLAQEFRSSTGLLSLYAHELKSHPGTLQELRSNPGYLQGLRSQPGLLAGEAPATPMPSEPPLVRVLETYDLRETQARHFLRERASEETGEHALISYSEQDLWPFAPRTRKLNFDHQVADYLDEHFSLSDDEFPRSEPGEPPEPYYPV